MIRGTDFQTYLYLNNTQYIIYVSDNKSNEKIYSEKLTIEENSSKLKLSKLDEFLDSNILKIEKKLNNFIKNIYVILDSEEFHSIKLSIKKDNNGNLINSETLIHPLNDLKNLCQSNLQNEKVIHFLIEKYVIDNKFYTTLPENIICNIFSLDTEFICLSKSLIENIEKILKKYHISVNQILSATYLEKFKDNKDNTIFTTASRIISGHNSNEVLLIGKIIKKQGFFEKFFNFFD